MLDKEVLKNKIFDMLDSCNEQFGKYKELRSNGLSQDLMYESIINTRKQILSEILEFILNK